jgi:hypothetical protein
MTNQYLIKINSPATRAALKVSYKDKRFNGFDIISGVIIDAQKHEALMKLMPLFESQIQQLKTSLQVKGITYHQIEKMDIKSQFTSMMALYNGWYKVECKRLPRINATEGKALKDMLKYLNSICTTEAEVMLIWSKIFKNWKELTPFLQTQTELRQINSQLNVILRVVCKEEQNLDDVFKSMIHE